MKYKSCHLLEHGISIEDDAITACCIIRESLKGKPVILDKLPENIDWDELFRIKRKQRNLQKEGGFPECVGCNQIKEDEWDDEDFISYINFNHWSYCNSDCIYCGVHNNLNRLRTNILPSIRKLIELGKFRDYGEITFQGGEPTILPEFEELLYMFVNNCYIIRVHSSGIVYSPAIKKCLEQKSVIVVISPDSGCKKTYKRIKRVNKFDSVWTNIEKYRKDLSEEKAKYVKVKYIIIPKINDTREEVDAFLNKIKEYDIKTVIVDVEYSYAYLNNYNVSPHIYMLIDYIENFAKDNNIDYELYETAQSLEKTRDFEKTTCFEPSFFNKKFSKYRKNDKTKKVKYSKTLKDKLYDIINRNRR